MLINFSFKNFKSFHQQTELDMHASKDRTHPTNLFSANKKKISKIRLIYGANASGKTNLIQAIEFVSSFVLLTNRLFEQDEIKVEPFKFVQDDPKKPTEFDIDFIKDNVRYNYSFACTQTMVTKEKLDIYYTSKPTNIYTRSNATTYKFNCDNRFLNDIAQRTTKNKLFLATTALWNYDKTKPVVDFFLNDLITMYDTRQPNLYNLDNIIQQNELEDYKKFCLDFMNNADLNIEDFIIDIKQQRAYDKEFEFFLKKQQGVLTQQKNQNPIEYRHVYDITTIHKITKDNDTTQYPLKLFEESKGTKEIFYMAPTLYYTFKYGKTLLIDEIDKSLHPLIVLYIIKKFLNPDFNKNNAQLICNTHDTNLLDLDVVRRDEVLFVDKDYDTGESELYSLDDFSIRSNHNIEKSYLLGRFGAIPFLKEL